MAAAYRVVVSSVSYYNSVVVDRRARSHAVHYCSGPCGALSLGLDCTVAHCGTCSELLVAPDPSYIDPNSIDSRNMITQQLPNLGKISVTMDTSCNGGAERANSSGNLSFGEDSPMWRGKRTPSVGGSTGNLSSSGSLKDITEEAINLASGKLKEFSFDKLRLSSSSHVTFRKGRKVRPDSFSRRSTDLEMIYGHLSSHSTSNGMTNGLTNGAAAAADENLPPFVPGRGLEEVRPKGSHLSAITKAAGGSSGVGSLDQSLNSVASLYLNTLGEENLIARLLEKTRAEAGPGGAGGEDIRACLDILLKCSEDLKKCTDIIKQCIRSKAGGGPEGGGASPDSMYRAVMSRLGSYLKRLPLELEGIGSLGGSGHNDLAELVNTLHSIQPGPFSLIFGNEQPPRYEDVVRSPPIPKTGPHSASPSSVLSSSSSTKPVQSCPPRAIPPISGQQHPQPVSQHALSAASRSSPAQTPVPLRASPTPPYTHTPPASPMEALYIEEEEADLDKMSEQISQHTPSREVKTTQNRNGTTSGQHTSTPHILQNSNFTSHTTTQPSSSHRNDDIDKLLMDLENLSQSMSHPRNNEPPLPAKTRKRDGAQRIAFGDPKVTQLQCHRPDGQLAMNGSRIPQSAPRVGEEEDGVLLLRILESIESFAQELVDSGAGSTGSAEKNSGKEREVMRLLQDTLASTGRTDTPLEILNSTDVPSTPPIDAAPAIPPKHSLAESPAGSEAECNATSEPAQPAPKPPLAPGPPAETTDGEFSTDEADPESVPASVTHLSLSSSSRSAEPSPAAPVVIPAVETASGRDTGSTLLIRQIPEVIRVQSKPEKKPDTPPPSPAPPTPRSPSPPPAPLVVIPPPPAINIPRFYYPCGLPALGAVANHDAAIAAIEAAFAEFEEEKADIYEMGKIAKACGCPLYWKGPMFYSAGGERTGFVSVHAFIATWRKLLHSCHDDSSRFVFLLAKPGCSYLEQEDLIPLLQDIVDTHPGLTFLKDAPEFHSRYITTVIQRIFYVVNRSWTGRVTMMELRRSNFLQTLALLEEEDDINQITDYFSYEHFYVIYCRFWELDTDHDLYIDPKDLAQYNDHASSSRIIQSLFSGAVTRGNAVQREGRMSYAEFVWFLISEEDKKNPTSIEYWFRCMDTDGDGVLSMFELEYFYEEQCERMERMGIEPLPFQDLLCQMLDLVKPENQGKITLGDLKRCRMAHIFFDTFFNLEKYLDHEQRDPFAVQKDVDSDGPEPSDWDKYASEEYEILVAEETANDQLHDGSFDDDYESEELQLPAEIGTQMEKFVVSDLTA
ncbi:serine/threonine-protein phosphatase 2A regulatory subunit B'' subunit alpha [Brachionichthys hirsutus]|uniref:serine/threonine-protein phosphatase 2A regulatory subunit B'' subunit alpha n=1 Tax=Brachionichthys hirsutus TaxID=412623 RepID=UPI003604E267